ncbi:MAG: hypothetical protein AABX74_01210 [Nanoarchaeota archaeon]
MGLEATAYLIGMIKLDLGAALDQTKNVHAFTSAMAFYQGAMQAIRHLQEWGHEIPQDVLTLSEQARSKVFDPARLTEVLDYGRKLAAGNFATYDTAYRAMLWIDGVPTLTREAGIELPEGYGGIVNEMSSSGLPRLLRYAQDSIQNDPGLAKRRFRNAVELREKIVGRGVEMPQDVEALFHETESMVSGLEGKL